MQICYVGKMDQISKAAIAASENALMEPLIESESQLISPLTKGKISIRRGEASTDAEDVEETGLSELTRFQYFQFNSNMQNTARPGLYRYCQGQCCCWHLFCVRVCKSEISYMLEGSATNGEQDQEGKEPTAKKFTLTGTSTRCSPGTALHLNVALGERQLFTISMKDTDGGCFRTCLGGDEESVPVNIKIISIATQSVLGHFTLRHSNSRGLEPKKGCRLYTIKCWREQQIRVERHRNVFKGHDYLVVRNCQEQIIAEMKSKPSLCTIEMAEDLNLNAKLKAVLLGFMIAVEVEKLS